MKMADILRQLADKLDSIENTGEVASVDSQPAMMSPNQQKLELLKKGVGVESAFDSNSTEELDTIKRHAGINPAVAQLASDDEPTE